MYDRSAFSSTTLRVGTLGENRIGMVRRRDRRRELEEETMIDERLARMKGLLDAARRVEQDQHASQEELDASREDPMDRVTRLHEEAVAYVDDEHPELRAFKEAAIRMSDSAYTEEAINELLLAALVYSDSWLMEPTGVVAKLRDKIIEAKEAGREAREAEDAARKELKLYLSASGKKTGKIGKSKRRK